MNPESLFRAFAVGSFTLALTLIAGCSGDFAGEEMRLGTEDKVRPLGVILDPPEVAPGEAVEVSLYWYDPLSGSTQVDWRVAMEFDPGFYGVDPVERQYLMIPSAGDGAVSTTDQGDGFFVQTFRFTVPVDAILRSPNMVALQTDPVVEALAVTLAPGVDPTPEGWNEFLSSLTPEDLDGLDSETALSIRRMADLFAAQIRFRATLEHGSTVGVTRNLTVRYSSSLGSTEVNRNPGIDRWSVVGVPARDALWSEHTEYLGDLEWTELASGDVVQGEVEVQRKDGWTYYLVCESEPQTYASPYGPDRPLEELLSYRWFRFRADDPASDTPLFVRDDGEEADSFDLDEAVRIEPEAAEGGTRYRICLVVRDERPEWRRYQATPGQRLALADLVFTAP